MKKFLAFLSVIAFAALAAAAQERYLKPVDEADQDASFLAFRTKLISAVERKDANYIYSIVDPNIKNGFGDRNGIAWFKRDWKLQNKNSEFWKKFASVINNGGKFEGDQPKMFIAPFSFSNWPDDLDSFEYFVIFGSNVNLRKTPGMSGEILSRLSHNVIKVLEEEPHVGRKDWRKVETLGGQTGYVSADYVRSPIDYRAGFEKKRGKWVMTFFLAGD
jgi:hypothetical protein